MRKRKDLKIIISSATLDTRIYLDFFQEFTVSQCHVEGRMYPVDICYLNEPVSNYIDSALSVVMSIDNNYPKDGDILVFLTSAEDILAFQKGFN